MRTIAKAAAAAVTAVLLAVAPTASAHGNPHLIQGADRIMALPAEEFAAAEHTPPFNWTSDGCSVPGGMAPYMKLFTPACAQHDFGYRNYGTHADSSLGLDPTPRRKKAIDDRFLEEIRRICDKERPGPIRHTACYGAAHAFYDAVRIGGAPAFY
ncbi:phospholipase A2 [Streptomyces sp. NPDC002851]